MDNAGDDLAAVRHVNACGGPPDGRAVLQPTPGASDVATLGWDLLVAVAKPPHAARRERVSGLSWEYGRAWLAGFAVKHMIVDRAHLLTRDQTDAAAAAQAGATLWLLWGTGTGPRCGGPPHLVGGQPAQVISLWDFYQRLPAAPRPAAAELGQEDSWPPLPAADFPTFLAACRRYLPRAQFAQVARLYYDTAEAADAWLETYGAARDPRDGQLTSAFEAALTSWLRDSAIGPAPCGPAALVRLRAVQAALFTHAIVLSWQPGPLGPSPPPGCPATSPPDRCGAGHGGPHRRGRDRAVGTPQPQAVVLRRAAAGRRRPGRVRHPRPRRPSPARPARHHSRGRRRVRPDARGRRGA